MSSHAMSSIRQTLLRVGDQRISRPARGDIGAINWRSMPAAYKDLWEELEAAKKEKDDMEKRRVWFRDCCLGLRGAIVRRLSRRCLGLPLDDIANFRPDSTFQRPGTMDEKLQSAFEARVASTAYQKMRRQRDFLPIASFREQIISTLGSSQNSCLKRRLQLLVHCSWTLTDGFRDCCLGLRGAIVRRLSISEDATTARFSSHRLVPRADNIDLGLLSDYGLVRRDGVWQVDPPNSCDTR
jgi:hypothetical protein